MQLDTEPAQTFPPMLLQYLEHKKQRPDCLIFFQVGDFYELFFEDAKTVAKTLNLTLTSRDKSNPNPIPMCGVPVSVIDGYVERLVDAGFSVAIISQDQNGVQGKGMVNRSLERVVTPAVRILGQPTKEFSPSYLAAVYLKDLKQAALAWCEVQSGKILVVEDLLISELRNEVSRIAPNELVICSADGDLDRRTVWIRDFERQIAGGLKFRSASQAEMTQFDSIGGIGQLRGAGKRAARLLCSYIDETTVNVNATINSVEIYNAADCVAIDTTTRRNLELLRAGRDLSSKGSLFWLLNKTVTSGGARQLATWLSAPSISILTIESRQKAVEALLSDNQKLEELRSLLERATDLERIAARVSLGVVSPKELGAMRDTLMLLPEIRSLLSSINSSLLKEIANQLLIDKQPLELSANYLVDNPPYLLSEGGIIRAGFDPEIDRLRDIKSNGSGWISEFELQERQRTGIGSLKVKYNQVLGYFIEVTAVNATKVPTEYIKRQSTANTERFTLPELKSRESEIVTAFDKQVALEKKLFEELKAKLTPYQDALRKVTQALSTVDLLASFAEVAKDEDYTKPILSEDCRLLIEEGKHPVLNSIKRHEVTANSLDCNIAGNLSYVITGPNMGGKSTFLKQNALIVIMAQIGSFVPAKRAEIGIVDKIFARVGASDDLLEGDSTFMVEMREASRILSDATDKSLVLIDELGRGTATSDGLALARAILEWLTVKTKCRTLFATHFHELTSVAEILPKVGNLSVTAVETSEGEVLFTHQIKNQPANRSYGIEVAALAGIPDEVLNRARELLSTESQQPKNVSLQMPLFTKPVDSSKKELQTLRDTILKIDPNNITPLQALQWVITLQNSQK